MTVPRAGYICFVTLLIAGGCRTAPAPRPSFAGQVGAAHGAEEWFMEQALQGELLIRFDSGEIVDLRFILEVGGPRIRMMVGDGTPEGAARPVVFDGQRLWVSPDGPAEAEARRIIAQWPTLITLPFRLGSLDVSVEQLGTRMLGAAAHDAAKVTFAHAIPGLGEWLLIYVEPETRLIRAVIYAPDDEPRAITFYDFQDVSGVRFGTEWKFWKWTDEVGIYDKPIATGRLFNLGFTTIGSRLFRPPPQGRQVTASQDP